MLNTHLHIWDSVWAAEYNQMIKSQNKSSNTTGNNIETKPDIMVRKTNKRGKN